MNAATEPMNAPMNATTPTDPSVFKTLQSYVGRAYLPGLFDCADLAALVQLEVFARAVDLPTGRHRPAGRAGQRRDIAALRDTLARPVIEPATGCGALLVEPGAGGDLWHIGTVAVHGGEVWVLHNSERLGSAHLHRLQDLQRWGMRLEGFYAWN